MKSRLSRISTTTSGLDTVPLRIGGGIIFTAHGSQKLFGWFGGYGLEGTAGWMDSIGLSPGIFMATLAGSAEFFGGLLLIIGLLVRPAALLLAITMLVTFLYGSLVWGIFPDFYPEKNISYESHFWGLIAGSVLAFYFRKDGPKRKKYNWEIEEEMEEIKAEESRREEERSIETAKNRMIRYIYENDNKSD